jgi:DNA gyrase inhibitor GyrI
MSGNVPIINLNWYQLSFGEIFSGIYAVWVSTFLVEAGPGPICNKLVFPETDTKGGALPTRQCNFYFRSRRPFSKAYQSLAGKLKQRDWRNPAAATVRLVKQTIVAPSTATVKCSPCNI